MLSAAAHPLIGIDPDIRFGRPCIAGTRISVRDVLGWLGNGLSVAEIIENFPELTVETIAAAQAYAADALPSYRLDQKPDFRVTYRMFTEIEGGRQTPAYQHIRWDFCYADDISEAAWMLVYPEFLDADGQVIPNGPFSPVGQADIFVLNPAQRHFHRHFHRQHIRPGVRGYFLEGNRQVGIWEVAEVLGLRPSPALAGEK